MLEPKIEEVLAELLDIQGSIDWWIVTGDREEDGDCEGESDSVDVRIQVASDGSWSIHSGDACYDTDHRGYWGASSIGQYDSAEELRSVAEDIIGQAMDSFHEENS